MSSDRDARDVRDRIILNKLKRDARPTTRLVLILFRIGGLER